MAPALLQPNCGHLAKVSRIEVGFDRAFENHWWIVLRVIWKVMAIAMVLGLTGLLGRGPVAKRTARAPGLVTYDRLLRFKTPAEIDLELASKRSEPLTVEITGSCFHRARVQRIMPPPVSSLPCGQGALYRFPEAAAGSTVFVSIALEPGSIGAAPSSR